MVKYPGKIPAGSSTGEFKTMEDWLPTRMSWVGQPNVKEELLKGKTAGKMNYKVHLDGYDQSDMILRGGKTIRQNFYYFTEVLFMVSAMATGNFYIKTRKNGSMPHRKN